jgi:hypothetical protein
MARTVEKKGNVIAQSMNWLIYHMFVVPKTQTKIFDLGYQLYTFELFHMKFANRLSHFIGIPLNLIALYCIFLPNTWLAIIPLAIVAGHHIILAVKYRLYSFIPILIAFHALFWFAAVFVFEPFLFNGAVWYMNPVFHFFFWPFLQYVTHGIEKLIPRPWSLKGNWMRLQEYWFKAPWYKSVLMVSFMPLHSIVELVSSWRNLYLELLLFANKLGYTPSWFQAAQKWIYQEIHSEDPIISYEDYLAEFEPAIEQALNLHTAAAN